MHDQAPKGLQSSAANKAAAGTGPNQPTVHQYVTLIAGQAGFGNILCCMSIQERMIHMKRHKKSLPRVFHWTLAIIFSITIFILVMTITFTEV
jgi:ABC-type Fe3+-siderophore transport system permease subunit